MRILFTLRLPTDVWSVPFVRSLCRANLTALGVEDGCVDDVAVAVTEACANVIVHTRDAGTEYGVELAVDPGCCQIRVADDGPGFDGADGARAEEAVALAESGRGVALMRALVDELHFLAGAERGTVVQLTKRLSLRPDAPLGVSRPGAPLGVRRPGAPWARHGPAIPAVG